MSIVAQSPLYCPACGHELARNEQHRMNTVLLGAAKPVACLGCGQLLQWRRSLRTRMSLGGLLFRLGVAAAM
jgi:ribosomal protein S27E